MNPPGSKGAMQEEATEALAKVPLRKGAIMLLLEERPNLIYGIFKGFTRSKDLDKDGPKEAVNDPTKLDSDAMIITRQYPKDLKLDQELEGHPIYWLTSNISSSEVTISPSAITKLNYLMSEFLKRPGDGIVIIDCIEYLITQNSFETVLRLIQSWNDKIVGTKRRMVLSIDPLTLSIRQLHLIKRETLEIMEE